MTKTLLISITSDRSTSKIIDWLIFYSKEYLRICLENDFLINVNISIKNDDINLIFSNLNDKKNFSINVNEISSVYYRNGGFKYLLNYDFENELYSKLVKEINKYSENEIDTLIDFIYYFLSEKKTLGNYESRKQNKLLNLKLAKKCGLLIPNSAILSEKKDLFTFYSQENQIITKPIFEIFTATDGNYHYCNYTQPVSEEMILEQKEKLFPQLFQQKVTKKYELRIFFMFDKYFPLAIFNNTNNVDWRSNINNKNFMRHVPYNLPNEILKKLKNLMDIIGLNTGSIDMIVTPENNYVFLEVNPLGQYSELSEMGNYYIEKQIAEYLIS